MIKLRKYQQPIHPYHALQNILSQMENAQILLHLGDMKILIHFYLTMILFFNILIYISILYYAVVIGYCFKSTIY